MENLLDLGGGRKKAGRGEMPCLSWEERDGEIGGKLEGGQGALREVPPASTMTGARCPIALSLHTRRGETRAGI